MKDDEITLVVDTSGATLAVGIFKGNLPLCISNEVTNLTHSQTLMVKIAEIMSKLNLKSRDIDYYACVNGPGSFTGLRIGVATVKGLAHGNEKPMVEISTLQSLGRNVWDFDGIICPIIDARRKEVYTCAYYKRNLVLNECNISLTKLFEELKKYNKKVMFVGDGVIPYKELILENMNSLCVFASEEKLLQSALSAGKIAIEKIMNKDTVHYKDFSVSYLKPTQPEMELKNKRKAT